MDQMAPYDPSTALSAGARDTYVANNPRVPGTELALINTQYWISSFLNGLEAFANFRRSGFPSLTPNPYGQPDNPDVPNGYGGIYNKSFGFYYISSLKNSKTSCFYKGSCIL